MVTVSNWNTAKSPLASRGPVIHTSFLLEKADMGYRNIDTSKLSIPKIFTPPGEKIFSLQREIKVHEKCFGFEKL